MEILWSKLTRTMKISCKECLSNWVHITQEEVCCISSSSSLPYLPVRLVNLATAYVLLFGVASDRSELCYSNASWAGVVAILSAIVWLFGILASYNLGIKLQIYSNQVQVLIKIPGQLHFLLSYRCYFLWIMLSSWFLAFGWLIQRCVILLWSHWCLNDLI